MLMRSIDGSIRAGVVGFKLFVGRCPADSFDPRRHLKVSPALDTEGWHKITIVKLFSMKLSPNLSGFAVT